MNFEWERLWCPYGRTYSLDAFGYVAPPSKYQNNHLVRTGATIADGPSASILLGDAGLGKTTVAKQLGVHAHLPQFSTDQGLISEVFRNERVLEWKAGSHQLTLVLDGLDECRLHVATLSALLAKQIEQLPTDRLRVVLVCRTASWIRSFQSLEETIRAEFTTVSKYEMLPLQRHDVAAAAIQAGVAPASFLDAVEAKHVSSLASRPVSLKLLLPLFRENAQLPGTRADLYSQGLLRIAEESKSRTDSGSPLDAESRLLVAARIAAAMTLSGYTSIGFRGGPSALSYKDLEGEESGVTVDETTVREVLESGLFTGSADSHLSFTHYTYQEFLSAQFLLNREMDAEELLALLQLDQLGRVPPQLTGLAGWLAALQPELSVTLIQSDPGVVLSAAPALSDEQRRMLVESILDKFESGELATRWWDGRTHYTSLASNTLAPLLDPVVADATKALVVRLVAMDILVADSHFDPALVQRVGLSQSAHIKLRETAARALASVDDRDVRRVLRPLLELPREEDPDDTLRACALRALWPDDLSIDELLSHLVPPQRDSYFGAYKLFLSGLPDQLSLDELCSALTWAAEARYDRGKYDAITRLQTALVAQGLKSFEESRVQEALLKPLLPRLVARDRELTFIKEWPRQRRRSLARIIAPYLSRWHESTVLDLVLNNDDLAWAIEQLETNHKPWCWVIRWLHDRTNSSQVDAVLEAYQHLPEDLRPLLYVELESETASHLRQNEEWERRHAELQSQRSWDELVRFVSHPSQHLLRWSRFIEDLGHRAPHLSPRWSEATERHKEQIKAAATAVILSGEPDLKQYLKTGSAQSRDLDGYYAWELLADEQPEKLAELPSAVWRQWAALLFAGAHQNETATALRAMAALHAPDEVTATVVALIRKQDRKSEPQYHLRHVAQIWGAQLEAALLSELEGGLSVQSQAELLRVLLAHECAQAQTYALANINKAPIASALLDSPSVEFLWSQIWAVVTSDNAYGRRLFEEYAGHSQSLLDRPPPLVKTLRDEQLGTLYTWLRAELPDADRALSEFGDTILRELVHRATPEAVKVLAALAESNPELRYSLGKARESARKNAWAPLTLEAVLQLGRVALDKLVQLGGAVVDRLGTRPLALVLNGGGVKGAAFCGALVELYRRVEIEPRAFCGTSAGAITATALAMGYKPETIETIMRQVSFLDFLDSKWQPDTYTHPANLVPPNRSRMSRLGLRFRRWISGVSAFLGLLWTGALYSTEPVGRFIRHLAIWRPRDDGPRAEPDVHIGTKIRDLDPTLLIVASSSGDSNTYVFENEQQIEFAVRCSMAIPGFFAGQKQGTESLYDGGLVANFAFEEARKRLADHDIIGLYLYDAASRTRHGDQKAGLWGLLKTTVRIFLGQDEMSVLQKHRSSIIRIDTNPIQTLDFDLSSEDLDLLVDAGRLAVLRYLVEEDHGLKLKPGIEPSLEEYEAEARRIQTERAQARKRWEWPHRRQRIRFWSGVIVLVLAIVSLVAVPAYLLGRPP